jgi:hypothetical protein
VFDNKGIVVPSAGRRKQNRLAHGGCRNDQVHDLLEQSGIAALMDRACDDQGIGCRERIHVPDKCLVFAEGTPRNVLGKAAGFRCQFHKPTMR